jgi:hypothetical protein
MASLTPPAADLLITALQETFARCVTTVLDRIPGDANLCTDKQLAKDTIGVIAAQINKDEAKLRIVMAAVFEKVKVDGSWAIHATSIYD